MEGRQVGGTGEESVVSLSEKIGKKTVYENGELFGFRAVHSSPGSVVI